MCRNAEESKKKQLNSSACIHILTVKEERKIWASVEQSNKIRGGSTISHTVVVVKRGSLQLVARVMWEVAFVYQQ